jgi:septal ring factor EnvC (AmiA/AmiB activator)
MPICPRTNFCFVRFVVVLRSLTDAVRVFAACDRPAARHEDGRSGVASLRRVQDGNGGTIRAVGTRERRRGVGRSARGWVALAAGALLLVAAVVVARGDTPSPSPTPPAAGAPVDERLRVVQARRAALEQELARLRGRERSLLGEVEQIELEVRLSGEQLHETQLLLQRTNAELDRTLARVRALDESIRQARPLLRARARSLYKLGELSYVRLLLSVEQPADLFRGYRFVTALARRDNERFAAFRADLRALETTRAELEQRTRDALALRADLERRRRGLQGQRRRKTELLTHIVERKETHASYVAELQAAEGQLERLVAGFGAGDVSVPVAAFRGSLPWPVTGAVRVPFGRRKHPRFDTYTLQNGILIDAPEDAPVAAVHGGTVVFAERFLGYGLMLIVDHGGKHHSLYAHLASARVGVGQRVSAGQTLGTVGADSLEGPGLYFELRVQGKAEDPAEWLVRTATR